MPKIRSKTSQTRRIAISEPETTEIFGTAFRQNGQCWVTPYEKGHPPFLLGNIKNVHDNDLVEIEPLNKRHTPEATLVKNYGPFSMGLLNEILITRKYKIPHKFSDGVLKECRNFPDFMSVKRTDLTNLPFVTIDGDDSRDFDDAVYASPDDNGFHLIVAIADVAFYVKPHSQLDTEAYTRGNSVYLPQQVIPMLPEILSNNLCSLNPKVKRPVITCSMHIDFWGNLTDWHFERAVIKSAARLTYKEVEAALNGNFNSTTKKIYKTVILPLFQTYQALFLARQNRGALELETDEIKIKFAANGEIVGIEKQQNLTSNRMIEEFMIAANVSAARFLSKFKEPVMYRIHEKPLEEKLNELKPLLSSLKMKLPAYPALQPKHFNKILDICHKKGTAGGLDNLILRLQCQAKYSPHNCGHFGLNLKQYAHFTSPIRRYADLMVHRSIIALSEWEQNQELPTLNVAEQTADHLCVTERTASAAERDICARYLSLFLKPLTGTEFNLKISGLSNAGIFVRLENLGAEGLIPMRTLPRDYYQLLDADSCLRGVESKIKFKLGDDICGRLLEAEPVTGGLIFSWLPEKSPNLSTPNKKSRGKHKNNKKRISKCSKR